MRQLILRNLRIFFRDRSAVFFSLLAVFIIIGLYVVFLGDMLAGSLEGMPSARFLMDSWIMGGVLAVTSATTTLGAFGIMIEDRHRKLNKDFYASPLRRGTLAGAYLVSSFLIGILVSLVALVLIELYILSGGGRLLPLDALFKVLGLIVLTVLSSSAMVAFLVTFFSSLNAYSSFSTVVGTLIGFLTGIYIPIGNLPESVQFAIKVFPVSHGAVLFRQVFMEVPMREAFVLAPSSVLLDFKLQLGVAYEVGGGLVPVWGHVLVLGVSALVFFLLAVWRFSGKRG